MKYRKLRIAWSIAWGVVCLLLVVLWVRSYWRWDSVQLGRSDSDYAVESNLGRLTIYYRRNVPAPWETSIHAGPTDKTWRHHLAFGWMHDEISPNFYLLYFPHWCLAVLVAILATVPWFHWRFSLRTLLIAMTVVAIGLGWIMCALR